MTISVRSLNGNVNTNLKITGPLGTKAPIKVDLTSGNFPVPSDIRAISACGGTKVVVDMVCKDKAITDVAIPIGLVGIMNVTFIKQTSDATDIWLWPIED